MTLKLIKNVEEKPVGAPSWLRDAGRLAGAALSVILAIGVVVGGVLALRNCTANGPETNEHAYKAYERAVDHVFDALGETCTKR